MKNCVLYFNVYPKYHCFMNSNYIRLWDVLEQMDRFNIMGKPIKFQIRFVTANRDHGTGGEIIEIKDGRKCSGKTKSGEPIFQKTKTVSVKDSVTRNPNHWVNSTRNILLPNGQIRKVHIRLIIEFNHQKVCY